MSVPSVIDFKFAEDELPDLTSSGIDLEEDIVDAEEDILETVIAKREPQLIKFEEKVAIVHDDIFDSVKKKKEDILPKEGPIVENIIEKEHPPAKPKKRKPLSEEHKAKLAVSRAKALEVRRAKAIERKKMKELELEEKELLKTQKIKKFQKLKEEVTGEAPLAPKEEKRVGPLAQPPDNGFITKKDLEQAQLDAIMKYEAIRKVRKEEKKKTALVEAEKQKMLNTINRAVGGQYYKYRDGSNIWDRCY